MENPNATPTPDDERPEEIIDEIAATLEKAHKDLTQAAAAIGVERERVQATRPLWQELSDTPTLDADLAEVYHTGVHALRAYRDEVTFLADNIAVVGPQAHAISASSDGLVAMTATTHTLLQRGAVSLTIAPPTLPPPEEYARTEKRLAHLDPSLAKTYSGVRESLYATSADSERAALFQSRQVFDHLFAILAPDDEVRGSRHWRPKTEGDANKVTRDERIRYAATERVVPPARGRSLLASSRHMLNVYEALNRAHTRGELAPAAARVALREMDLLISQWAEAVDASSTPSRNATSA